MSMHLPGDICNRIDADFPTSIDRELIYSLFSELQVSEKPRVLRCILVAANKDIDLIVKYEGLARTDYRDVIMAGEYDYLSDNRLRDLSHPFISKI